MGCSSAKEAGEGLVGTSAKEWLNLAGVPATFHILRRPNGVKGITVEAAGMDTYGLLGKIETAFRQRDLVIDMAHWSVRRALFHASFCLRPSTDRDTFEGGSVTGLTLEISEAEHSPAKGYQAHDEDSIHMKVQFTHSLREELRIGFLRLIHAFRGHTCQGEVSTSPASSEGESSMQQDSFWLDCPQSNVDLLLKGELASAEAFQQHLSQARKVLEEELVRVSSYNKAESGTADVSASNFVDHLRDADIRAMQQTLLELPPALRQTVKKATYKIEQSSWGNQVPGFQKFMGAGIVTEEGAMGKQSGAPIVQFTTFYVQDANTTSKSPGGIRSLNALTSRQYSEFVNSIDVNNGRVVVEKVFLNNVCPSGVGTGAYATAEQLWAPVWEKGANGSGELLPVNKIKEIKLSDVINWNTYCVMSTAMGMDFGEHFQSSVKQELQSAKCTLDNSKSKPKLEVFLNTKLGRFVGRILNLWHEWTGIRLECLEVHVSFREEYEIIAGEARHCMDLLIPVRVKEDNSSQAEVK